MKTRRWVPLSALILVLAAFLLAACRSNPQPGPAEDQPTPTVQTEAETVLPSQPEPPSGDTSTGAPTTAPKAATADAGGSPSAVVAPFEVPDIDSFRMRTAMTTTVPGDTSETGVVGIVIVHEVVKEPPALHAIMTLAGRPFLDVIEMDDQIWWRDATQTTYQQGGGEWMEQAQLFVAASTFGAWFPDLDLNCLEQVEPATVDGVETSHYKLAGVGECTEIDRSGAVGLGEIEAVEGDLYLTDEGRIVRWTMQGEIVGAGSESGSPGTLDFIQEVYDVNEEITIERPEVSGEEP